MRSLRWSVVLVAAFAACSGARVPEQPVVMVPWTPGRYLLEADFQSTSGGFSGGSTAANELEAELRIAADRSMMLLTSYGACSDPTREELERDEQMRRRTFRCGDALYVIQPTQDGVRGEVRARVLEEYRQQIPCAPGNPGPCSVVSTRRVVRTARLRVTELD